jgi:hypothetical protein
MTQVTATVAQAAQWVGGGASASAPWNPVYRALVDGAGSTAAGTSGARRSEDAGVGEAELDLVRRQLKARAVLVAAVTDDDRTHRFRAGLRPAAATLERADGEAASRWSEIDVADLPGELAAFLEETGIYPGPARLDVRRGGDALRLSPEQNRIAHDALRRGQGPEKSFGSIPDLDDSLRDALTATGPRLALSLTLHDPHGRVTQKPVTWSRLWARGSRGLYRVDRSAGAGLAVHPVGAGDVLGTLPPVLEQGLRFAAACVAEGEAR